MSRGKPGDAEGFWIDLIKDAGNFLLGKLSILFTKCLQKCTVPSTWKNAIMILIDKKRTHQRPNLLSSNKPPVCSIQAFYKCAQLIGLMPREQI